MLSTRLARLHGHMDVMRGKIPPHCADLHHTTMPDIHLCRDHHLTLTEARHIAFAWAEQAENEFGMACTYQEGADEDRMTFTRSGVNGTLKVCGQRFELDAKLGFLLGAFKDKIEGEIVKNLDQLLASAPRSPETQAPTRPSSQPDPQA
jgi:putative polyhydroxyalkanoate system protein